MSSTFQDEIKLLDNQEDKHCDWHGNIEYVSWMQVGESAEVYFAAVTAFLLLSGIIVDIQLDWKIFYPLFWQLKMTTAVMRGTKKNDDNA